MDFGKRFHVYVIVLNIPNMTIILPSYHYSGSRDNTLKNRIFVKSPLI